MKDMPLRLRSTAALGLLLAATAAVCTACGGGSGTAAASPAAPSPSVTASPAGVTVAPSASPGGGSPKGGPALATHGEATPAAAVAGWVTAVLRGDVPGVCARTSPATAKSCPATSTALTSLRSAWGKNLHGATPRVSAAPVHPTGSSAVFADSQITVNGRSLRSIELEGARMSPGSSFTLSLTAVRIGHSWFVGTMDFNAGAKSSGTVTLPSS